jgi:MFS family permease
MTVAATEPATTSAWAPLRVRVFRALWLAQLGSMVGTWMQTVGAQWLLVDEPNAATLVSLVQAMAMLPVLLLAMPAGALADILDRRRLLVAVQAFQVVVGAGLTVLVLLDRLPPVLLLLGTLLLGCGTTLTIPGYQALVQEFVPRSQLPSVAALNGIAMNLARSVGPAVAGVLVAQLGVAVVFAVNALSYVAFAAVLIGLRREPPDRSQLPERFGGALAAGARYVRNAPAVRRMLLRTLLFGVPGSALWALLPLVASRRLALDASGYGLLLGALGVGAVAGALLLPRAGRFSKNTLILVAGLVFAAATVVSVSVPRVWVVLAVLVPAGAAWLTVLASLSGSLQAFLPGWVRARGLSVYQMAFAGGQAIGSIGWGLLAQHWGLEPALLTAAALMAGGALTVMVWPLHDVGGMDRNLAVYWPEPNLDLEPELEGGPVLVTRTFSVAPEQEQEFVAAMAAVRRSRLRTGATRCGLYREGEDPRRFVEVSLYPTWAEHLRQHTGRLTGADEAAEMAASRLVTHGPQVMHLFPAGATTPDRPDGQSS